ncbi:hypothetical protein [Anaerostipes faecis]|uniref:hypothetical protein n=1 Tax=Anaerostipes faecis TaxID=2880702 RepID=UPI002ED17187
MVKTPLAIKCRLTSQIQPRKDISNRKHCHLCPFIISLDSRIASQDLIDGFSATM